MPHTLRVSPSGSALTSPPRWRGWLTALLLLAAGTAVAQPTTYCNTNLGDWCGTADITTVAIANTSLNNAGTTCTSTGGSGYTLYPATGSTTATLSPGVTYQLSVTTAASAIISVWLDANQNGTFEASEWTQVTTSSTANQPATVAVTVPAAATTGLTRMRIRSRSAGNPNAATDACTSMGSGETEDYVVNIAPAAPCTAPPTAGTATASVTSICAPTAVILGLQGASFGTGLTYQWQQSSNGTTYTNITGATSSTYTTPALSATTYFRAVLTCSGQSATSAAVTVTRSAPTYATLPVNETFESAWINACATRDAPNNSWRGTPSPTDADASWRRDDDGTSAGWLSPTLGAYTPAGAAGSAHSARFHTYNASTGTIGFLDLYVNLSTPGAKVLTFDHINTSGSDTLTVHLSTDGGVTFGPALLRVTTAATWTNRTVTLPATTSATAVIRLRARSDFSTTDVGVDNVQIGLNTTVPSCVTNLSPANNATGLPRPVTISWASGGGFPSGYDVYFGTTATPPLVSANQVGTTYTPTALAANTTYYYQIVPRNANGVATGCTVNQFTTSGTFAYCNTNLGDWCGTADITRVTIANTSLNNASTTCNSSNGSSYTSYPASGSTTGTLSPGSTYQLSVTTAASAIISVWVDYNQNGTFEASEWTQVTTSSTANQPATVAITVPAGASTGQTGLRIRSRSALNPNGAGDACTSFGSGEAEDYIITIAPAAPCTAPPTAGTATASNTSFCTPTSVTVGLQGASFGTGLTYQWQQSSNGTTYTNITGATSSTYTTPVLTATTYFRAILTCSGQSATSAAVTVALNGPTYATLPVTETFESNWVDGCATRDLPSLSWRNTPSPTDVDASWRRDDDGASAGWTSPTFGAYTPTGATGSAHSARFHGSYGTSGTVGTLDLYANLSAAGPKRLTFDYINTSGTDSVTVHLSTDGGATFGPALLRLGVSGTVAQAFQSQAVNIITTSATAVIRFRGRADFGSTDIGIDNVRLETTSGCLSPTNLALGTISGSSAQISWASAGTGTYEVEYGPSGFTLGTGTTIPVTGTSTTITGLIQGVTYQAYVRQVCSPTSKSGNAGPITISTGACPVPTALGATGITSSSALLEWAGTSGSTVTFSIEYGISGFTQGTGTVVSGLTGTTTTISNLAANTNYCFYVKQVCAPGSASTSAAAGPFCFRTSAAPALNDDPCGAPALALGSVVQSNNAGATATTVGGIPAQLPACSPANAPRDVWYTVTVPAGATGLSLTLTGAATGMVRLYTAATCSTGFQQVGCRAAATNQSVGTVSFAGLTAGTTYYVAVSGFGNADTQGAFTISSAVLAARHELAVGSVDVFPNPTNSGSVSVRISGAGSARSGNAVLINALGQVVRTQGLTLVNGAAEQKLSTTGLSRGVYTLRLQVGQELITRQVVLD
ncbi:T9SS type A sorting domain-containing protein [Hymenobacter busanensis]|uniref:T9SS type A sorting domain-containing protein n=1 Tax=Hymenobacter busanensis TaxID=2607656 RepID=A0A7L4ZUL0_9BACT|nr:GEVED domain-containing protein [Hymenobacter busanensis]KAA9327195.1 T9SS type A sorting domain-containing protein [Hymenobacter busanensis]QHJ05862.1 T9SS type A sorting domain-containing protein [Hymenobacter busanensis]